MKMKKVESWELWRYADDHPESTTVDQGFAATEAEM